MGFFDLNCCSEGYDMKGLVVWILHLPPELSEAEGWKEVLQG